MKLSELLPHGNQIIEESKQLFIASTDFSFNGLPILKDSLVHVDPEKISVNILSMSTLDAIYKETYGFNGTLPKEDNMWYLVEKESRCSKEAIKLPDDGECIWHKNHFDRYRIRSKYLNSRLKKREPELEYKDVKFSSIFYQYDLKSHRLTRFINLEPINILKWDITLPRHMVLFEHNEDRTNGNDHYIIIPLNQMVYNGVFFDSDTELKMNCDTIGGYISKGFKIRGRLMKGSIETDQFVTIDVPKNHYAYIGHNVDHIGIVLNGQAYIFKGCHINSNSQEGENPILFDGGTFTTYETTQTDPL